MVLRDAVTVWGNWVNGKSLTIFLFTAKGEMIRIFLNKKESLSTHKEKNMHILSLDFENS